MLEMFAYDVLDGSILKWRENPKDVIHSSISEIKNILNSILENYLKNPDPSILEKAISLEKNWVMCPLCQEAWESAAIDGIIICSKCDSILLNSHANSYI